MGGVCSGGAKGQKTKLDEKKNSEQSRKLKSKKIVGKQKQKPKNHTTRDIGGFETKQQRHDSVDIPISFSSELKPSRASRTTSTNKVSHKSSFLGRASTVGIEKAVEVLDTLGSSMSNMNAGSGFISGVVSRGNKITILAFEVANTITKGSSLMQSLSEESIRFLKTDVFGSEGVQKLVSSDKNELLRIAAADKRDELDVFAREVIRFGDRCKDPQWHNLGRYFSKLDTDHLSHKKLTEEAGTRMKELLTLAQYTYELYHELNTLDSFEQDYKQKLDEAEYLNLPKRGESLAILRHELKQQRKLVRNLKKKALWSRTLEEIMEKLVDIVAYMHQAISKAFGGTVLPQKGTAEGHQRLGVAGLALHYANVIHQIDNMVSRSGSRPPNMRDSLYRSLPVTVKNALRSHLQSFDVKEELSISQVKSETEKALHWLVSMAANTTKAHQGFGWVGEWANTGNEFSKNASTDNLTRLQTLHHADKQKTDGYILELVTWLHHLISLVQQKDHGFKLQPHPSAPPNRKGLDFRSTMQQVLSANNISRTYRIELSLEEKYILENVNKTRLVRGVSKSQHFSVEKQKGVVNWTLSKSAGNSRRSSGRQQLPAHPKRNILDVMDGLDHTFLDSLH